MALPNLPRARRVLKILVIFLVGAVLLNLAFRLYNFANLFGFFKHHSGTLLNQREILDAYNAHQLLKDTTAEPVIPKILHQVYHNWTDPESAVLTLPGDWEAARQSCIALNPDWEYKLWTAKVSREFIEYEFPWFLSTYDSYKFPIQRIDVIRYFALRHFGGIYIDLDNGCLQSLDAITYFPAFTTDGGHGTLSNNIIGGQPGHPFFHFLTESLMAWNWNWILPYVIVSYTSGQWFVTAMWEEYHRLLSSDGTVKGFDSGRWHPLHHILMDMRPDQPDPYIFWNQQHGGTWDNWDSAWFGWIGSHIGLVIEEVLGSIALVALVITSCVWGCRYYAARRRRTHGHKKVEIHDTL
ncbi:nucleotide-diphospho-sugar transferase [Xylariaceae sp. FL1651]|nr:nucleotide-diphospho-sugar transferase [Xylariaceae sp. FL1651]